MVFWLMVTLLLVGSSALLVVPALYPVNNSTFVMRDNLNKAFYQNCLQELEQDEAQGIVLERAEVIEELQQNLLTDIPERQNENTRFINRWSLLPGVIVLVMVAVGLYLKIGGLTQIQLWQQVAAQVPEIRARLVNRRVERLSVEEISLLGVGLQISLQADADNVKDWMLLGRVNIVLNNTMMAIQAFSSAYRLAPNNPQVKLAYAEVLTRSDDLQDNQQAAQILRAMVEQDHNNLRALGLLALNAFRQSDFEKAIVIWEIMLKLLPVDDKYAAMVRRSVEQAKLHVRTR